MSPSDELLIDLAALSGDPYRFVLWAFPWGEAGTELKDSPGPQTWQIEALCSIRDGLLTPDEAIQQAIASGHGIGKSALVSWIILWGLSTFEDTRGVVTANTETQLKTKTWVELAKWHRLFIAKELFELTATKICSRDPVHADTWRVDIIAWSERNTEAFAGLHNQGKRIILIFDEASSIPDIIWETSEGALTDIDTQIIWLVCGNPTRNTGRFKDCFGRLSNIWKTRQVDSREVSFTNRFQIAKWIRDYGEDSDFVRIRVKGIFPRTGSMEFISYEAAVAASQREISVHLHDPFVIGVDIARYGDDETVIYFRKGRDARTHAPIRLHSQDTMTVAGRVAEEYQRYGADAVFVDGGGVGGGVVDRLRQLHVPVWDIDFSKKADRANFDDATSYGNKRAEMWGSMREWIKTGCIPDDKDMIDQLCGPTYNFNARNEIMLEPKDVMKKRGLMSPDMADGLALTFAYPVMPHAFAGREGFDERVQLIQTDYNPFSEKHMAL